LFSFQAERQALGLEVNAMSGDRRQEWALVRPELPGQAGLQTEECEPSKQGNAGKGMKGSSFFF
jgi:hypothetical protein